MSNLFSAEHSLSRLNVFDFLSEDLNNDENANQFAINSEALDFVDVFPPELSDKLFLYLPIKDLMKCCQVSIAWRHVINNDRQWIIRCKQNGLVNGKLQATDPMKWTTSKSHVDSEIAFNRSESPAYSRTRVASNRIENLCTWGRYFRQCLHLERNWREGKYVVHKLKFGDEVCTTADATRKVLAVGTNFGSIYIWSVYGLPKFLEMIPEVRDRSELEQVRLTDHILVALYQIGLVRVYKMPEGYAKEKYEKLELLLQIRVWGLPSPNMQNEYTLFWQEVTDVQTLAPSESSLLLDTLTPIMTRTDINDNLVNASTPTEEDTEQLTRDLFRRNPWFDTEYQASDMIILLNENHLVVSGYACNGFLIFGFDTKDLVKKVKVPHGVQMCRQAIISSNTVYFTTKKLRNNQRFESTLSIFAYDLQEPFEFKEFRSQDLTEEIRMDVKNNPGKVVWIAQDSIIHCADLITQKSIFVKSGDGYVDNLLIHGNYIVYHKYDGMITCLNWTGEVVYTTEGSIGIARGFASYQDYLVCGGDGVELNILDVHTGKKLHKILQKPSRIEHIFVHDTKIICVGRDEPAMLIGYW